MHAVIFALFLLFSAPPANPPFDFDAATAANNRGKWSRSDIDRDGISRGVIQREYWFCGWAFVEDVYPFKGEPFRRVNTIWSLKRNN